MSTRDADRWMTDEREKHHKFDAKLAVKYGALTAAAAFMLEEACVAIADKAGANKNRYKRGTRLWQRWTAARLLSLCPYLETLDAARRALIRLSSGPRSLFVRRTKTGPNVGSDRAAYYALRNKPVERDLHTFLVEDANKYGVDAAAMLYRIRHWWRANHAKFVETGDRSSVGPGDLIEHRLVFSDLLEVQPYLSLTTAKRILGLLEEDNAIKIRRHKINCRRVEVYLRHPCAKSVGKRPKNDELDELDSDYLPGDPSLLPKNRVAIYYPQGDCDLSTKTHNGRPDCIMVDQNAQWDESEVTDNESDADEKNLLHSSRSKPPLASLAPALTLKENSSKMTQVAVATMRAESSTLCERPVSKPKVTEGEFDRSRYFTKNNPLNLATVKAALDALNGVSDHPGTELRPVVNRRLVKVNATDQ